ncbi:MAG: hypothetical protein M1840_008610 [Geoglossum simile]|nr:MAG: hypothetical protein M1840_008610 [Geoglossum simile]
MKQHMSQREPDWLKLVDSPPSSPDLAPTTVGALAFGSIPNGDPGSPIFPSKSNRIETTTPEPCPPFVFPGRPLSSPTTLTASLSRRPLSSHTPRGASHILDAEDLRDLNRNSTNVMPNFKSGSASHDLVTGMASPPLSPTSSLAIPPRPGGHRRGGSEFIGGDGKVGGPGLMSTSPTKGDGILPPPGPGPGLKPPSGRRGHAHRRSGAISCHDLSMILKPVDTNTGCRSAPVSPSEPSAMRDSLPPLGPEGQLPLPVIGSSADGITHNSLDKALSSESSIGARRSRVGFSDTLEFIPRPLSALSSETSSTLTTVRGHSVSGSISSIASGNTSSPYPGRERGTSLSTAFEDKSVQPRPSTAGAVLSVPTSNTKITFGDLIPSSSKRPSSASASPNVSVGSPVIPRFPPKKKHQSDIYHSASVSSPDVSAPIMSTEHAGEYLPQFLESPPLSPISAQPPNSNGQSEQKPDEARRATDPKSSKKQKRVKSWIFSRKSKYRTRKQKLARRSPTPPPLPNYALSTGPSPSDLELLSNPDCAFVTSNGGYCSQRLTSELGRSHPRMTGGPGPREMESMSPVIDLDAALGPFNTPSISPDPGSPFKGGFMAPKRRMHSSGRTGGFVGPGMHYHRRTESAPEMAPFDWGEFGLHRLASSSTMADVFEEDEENEDQEGLEVDSKLRRPKSETDAEKEEGLGIGIHVADTDSPRDGSGMDWAIESDKCFNRGLGEGIGLCETESSASNMGVKQKRGVDSPTKEVNPEETNSAFEVTNSDELTCPTSDARSSESTVTPPSVQGQFEGNRGAIESRPPPYPVFLAPDTPSSAASSTFPSPAFAPSSFDMDGRFPTARSSFTDDPTFDALLLGGPGPELRMSVDDVPSLTSSSSTMTSGINYNGQFGQHFESRAPAERSMSIASSQSSRSAAQKRSSLASLSRLVGSSHGEKSKLSNELNAHAETPERPSKDKKEKRWSRVMHFWKQSKSPARIE